MTSALFLVTVMLAVVVVTAAVIFVIETFVTRDLGAGRYWSFAFVLAMLTTICYLVWALVPEPYVAVALGNGAYIAGAGFIWLGCRGFNGRRHQGIIISIVVIVSAAATALALIAGPSGGDNAGGWIYFPAIALFAGFATFETVRGRIRTDPMAAALTFVFGFESVFFTARGIVLLLLGPESSLYTTWFGGTANGLLTIVLTIVTVVVVSTMRIRLGSGRAAIFALPDDQVLDDSTFRSAVDVIFARSARVAEHGAIAVVRLDDIADIGVAFGLEEEGDLRRLWRGAVRLSAPAWSVMGQIDSNAIAVAFRTESPLEARRIAGAVYRHVLDACAKNGAAVIPVIGVGLATTEDHGWATDRLVTAASAAARQSATSPDSSVIVAAS